MHAPPDLDPQHVDAAPVALLVARTCTGAGTAPEVAGYVITPGDAPLPEDEAIRVLAAAPKPVVSTISRRGQVVVIECERMTDADRAAYASKLVTTWPPGGYYAHARDTFGATYAERRAVCIGHGENLLVTIGSLELWRRDYWMDPMESAADAADSYWAKMHGFDTIAADCGADYISKFFAPEQDERPAASLSEGVDALSAVDLFCDVCRRQPVVRRLSVVRIGIASDETLAAEQDTPSRYLCASCAGEEELPEQLRLVQELRRRLDDSGAANRSRIAATVKRFTTMVEQYWLGESAPPELLAALDQLRTEAGGAGPDNPPGA